MKKLIKWMSVSNIIPMWRGLTIDGSIFVTSYTFLQGASFILYINNNVINAGFTINSKGRIAYGNKFYIKKDCTFDILLLNEICKEVMRSLNVINMLSFCNLSISNYMTKKEMMLNSYICYKKLLNGCY